MLDTETRRRIDEARDILVGKLPDPKSQVEQITIALIYKFMYDMDKEALDFGGKATFFTGEWEKYNWINIFDPKIGGHEMLNLYGEAIVKLNQNPNIPQLFRDIFKNAYLPYRDPETLKLFLKTINGFTYDHSERLGDAFEYLLSVLGSQGDAGQFRTPRHIIDFIVAVLQPKKNETICDPACGTAGFLISSYKYIVEQNTKKNKGDLLTPDDKKKMMQRFTGYDISPDMVRLSLVNMYLHNFTTPEIYEYDTLTSEERWNESFDIVMANPPFMSPKGGIKPHKKFSIQANRSEVLFVDYIMEHINPATGRAGVIVPEGIIFQSANAYKQLRQALVDKKYLYAVVSLPAGIFQPYSGVKTSVLLMDRTLAKKTDNILFVKIENDGFDLGAQRRAIDKNDLTAGLVHLQEYKEAVLNNTEFKSDNKNVFVVDKKIIKGTGDYNLSIERYRVNENNRYSNYEMVSLGDICEIQRGGSPRPIEHFITKDSDGINWIKIGDVSEDAKYVLQTKEKISKAGLNKTRLVYEGDFILSNSMSFGRPYILKIPGAIHDGWLLMRMRDKEIINQDYLYQVLRSDLVKEQYERLATGGVVRNLNSGLVSGVQIPLPTLSIQQQIVDKIESYQAIINGAKQVVQNYKPQIDIDPDWEMVELADIIDDLETGVSVNSESRTIEKNEIGILKTSAVTYGTFRPEEHKAVIPSEVNRVKCNPRKDSILISRMNTENLVGASVYINNNYNNLYLPDRLWQTVISRKDVYVQFVHLIISSEVYRKKISEICGGTSGSMKNISKGNFLSLFIPLPLFPIQQQIVNRIEQEQELVNANKELIKIYEQKIKDEINKLWKPVVKEYEVEEERVSVAAEE